MAFLILNCNTKLKLTDNTPNHTTTVNKSSREALPRHPLMPYTRQSEIVNVDRILEVPWVTVLDTTRSTSEVTLDHPFPVKLSIPETA